MSLAFVDLAHALALTTIAEGIETELQVQHLVELGCHTAQGYHLGPPALAHELERIAARRR